MSTGAKLEVGFNTNGNSSIGIDNKGKVIIQGEGIEINWETPYIDLKRSYATDYDGRIVLRNSNKLEILGTHLNPLGGLTLNGVAQAGGYGALWYGSGYQGVGLYIYKDDGWYFIA